MNRALLTQYLRAYLEKLEHAPAQAARELKERRERLAYYQGWTAKRLRTMSRDDLLEFFTRLWAMLIWGNKAYVVDKAIEDNGLDELRDGLADLMWGADPVAKRWDRFRKQIKGVGPAMMSELLCQAHPNECLLWNRRAIVGLSRLGVPDLPRYNYQLTGKRYAELCAVAREIAAEFAKLSGKPADLLLVDYFLWSELQSSESLDAAHRAALGDLPVLPPPVTTAKLDNTTAEFVHNEVRDKIANIGEWLGLRSHTEVKVADGAKVDAVWESTIGNMGRVIYVFEVQTKGSVDSLILNLLRSLNNPAVQGVVAVSDGADLLEVRKEAAGVQGLRDKLKCWDYAEVLAVYESLAVVNEKINRLGLVPQGF